MYPRTAKSIQLSPQVREALGIEDEKLSPNELIQAILRGARRPALERRHRHLREGVRRGSRRRRRQGQRRRPRRRPRACAAGSSARAATSASRSAARIEYALAGGRINTDAIDNVAGVNCSDHEVNIKILLGALVADGDMTREQRNELLTEMTDAVGDQVLYGSYTQTQAMSLGAGPGGVDGRRPRSADPPLEQVAGLDRELEFLPDDEDDLRAQGRARGAVAPELAVLMAYCKIWLYAELLESDLPDDPYLSHDLERYFPPPLPERYSDRMPSHRLAREIISTVVANQLVDRAGTTSRSACARRPARRRRCWRARTRPRARCSTCGLLDRRRGPRQRGRRATSRSNADRGPAAGRAGHPLAGAGQPADDRHRGGDPHVRSRREGVRAALSHVLEGNDSDAFHDRANELRKAHVPAKLATRVAAMPWMISVFDIVEVAAATGRNQAR